jgi:mannose-6-phosphate isomerase-like protein (cupin superfamily)
MKFTLDDNNVFGWPGLEGWAISSIDDLKDASAAYFEVTGSHGLVKSKSSNRVYFVIEGTGEFVIDGNKEEVKPKDVIIVPKNTFYDYRATSNILKLFLVHAPAYNKNDEIKG